MPGSDIDDDENFAALVDSSFIPDSQGTEPSKSLFVTDPPITSVSVYDQFNDAKPVDTWELCSPPRISQAPFKLSFSASDRLPNDCSSISDRFNDDTDCEELSENENVRPNCPLRVSQKLRRRRQPEKQVHLYAYG